MVTRSRKGKQPVAHLALEFWKLQVLTWKISTAFNASVSNMFPWWVFWSEFLGYPQMSIRFVAATFHPLRFVAATFHPLFMATFWGSPFSNTPIFRHTPSCSHSILAKPNRLVRTTGCVPPGSSQTTIWLCTNGGANPLRSGNISIFRIL